MNEMGGFTPRRGPILFRVIGLLLAIACLVLLLNLIFNLSAEGQERNEGRAHYAMMHPNYPCETMMLGYEGLPVLRNAVIYNTFGRSTKCLQVFAADTRPKVLEIHLINEVGHRNKRLGKYEVLSGIGVDDYRKRLEARDATLLARLDKYATKAAEIFQPYLPMIQTCYCSAGLESNLSVKAARVQNEVTCARHFPTCRAVWNPVNNNKQGGLRRIDGMVYELHGSRVTMEPPCIANLDGEDIDMIGRPGCTIPSLPETALPQYSSQFASCDANFYWIRENNGNGCGGFIDPQKRSTFVTKKTETTLNKYAKGQATVPPWDADDEKSKAGCRQFIKARDGQKKDFLWKQSDPPIPGRGAVVFAPKKFNKTNFREVSVYHKGKKTDVAWQKSKYTEDGSNRQFFRFKKLARDFPFNIVVHFGNVCAVVDTPQVRVD